MKGELGQHYWMIIQMEGIVLQRSEHDSWKESWPQVHQEIYKLSYKTYINNISPELCIQFLFGSDRIIRTLMRMTL